jgi:hypothetical protein
MHTKENKLQHLENQENLHVGTDSKPIHLFHWQQKHEEKMNLDPKYAVRDISFGKATHQYWYLRKGVVTPYSKL